MSQKIILKDRIRHHHPWIPLHREIDPRLERFGRASLCSLQDRIKIEKGADHQNHKKATKNLRENSGQPDSNEEMEESDDKSTPSAEKPESRKKARERLVRPNPKSCKKKGPKKKKRDKRFQATPNRPFLFPSPCKEEGNDDSKTKGAQKSYKLKRMSQNSCFLVNIKPG